MSRSPHRIVSNRLPANDAHLVQLVRGHLGRNSKLPEQKINVSSCGFVVSLHGLVPDFETRTELEIAVKEVSGILGVVNKLRVSVEDGAVVFPGARFGVSDLVEYPKVPE